MAEIKRFETSRKLSRVVVHNGTVYLSGITARDRTKGTQEQTLDVLEQIEALLEMGGSSKKHLLSAEIWIKNIQSDFALVNSLYEEWVPEGYAPVRAACSAHMSADDVKVEIWITAVEA